MSEKEVCGPLPNPFGKHLSEDGIIVVIITINSATGQLVAGPDIITRGFVQSAGADIMLEEAKTAIMDGIQAIMEEERRFGL